MCWQSKAIQMAAFELQISERPCLTAKCSRIWHSIEFDAFSEHVGGELPGHKVVGSRCKAGLESSSCCGEHTGCERKWSTLPAKATAYNLLHNITKFAIYALWHRGSLISSRITRHTSQNGGQSPLSGAMIACCDHNMPINHNQSK